MKAKMATRIDTLWSNQVELAVEAELDNPHMMTTEHLATYMAETLRVMAGELRSENEKVAFGIRQLNERHRRLDDRENELTVREHDADVRERDVLEHEREKERRGGHDG